MSYPFLRLGDRLPAVGVLQKLLNRAGARLVVDGLFGPRTEQAVRDFQKSSRIPVDGKVGIQTWPRVSAGANLPVIDCVDVFDPSLYSLEVADIRRAGGDPVVIGGMCNGVEQAVSAIVGAGRSVFLLRFHGHGARGVAGISSGSGDLDPGMKERADIALQNLDELRPVITRLRGIFGRFGCIQFMHCETGGGPTGRMLLSEIARLLGVPVTGGIQTQYGGGIRTFRFEGPTHTALPQGGAIPDWCRQLPDFPA